MVLTNTHMPTNEVTTSDPAVAENAALWNLIDGMDKAPEPGEQPGTPLGTQQVEGNGGVTLDVDQRIPADGVSSAGFSYIYDPETGERSMTNNNQLRQQLTKRDPFTGRVMFVPRTNKVPVRGTFKCMLHPDHEDWPKWARMGLQPCRARKSNLVSEVEVERHVQLKHKSAWATIERVRQRQERDEDRATQKQLADAMLVIGRTAAAAPQASPLASIPTATITESAGAATTYQTVINPQQRAPAKPQAKRKYKPRAKAKAAPKGGADGPAT